MTSKNSPETDAAEQRAEIAVVLAQPDFRERRAASGAGEPYVVSVEEFAARMCSDYEKYGKLIRAIGVKVE